MKDYHTNSHVIYLPHYTFTWVSRYLSIEFGPYTPETARLLRHWRHHRFSGIRPFFCQVEAVETLIWLTEVAPKSGKTGKNFLEHLINTNNEANPELRRLALKLATGARNGYDHRLADH